MYKTHDSQDFAITCAYNKPSEQSFNFHATIYRLKTNLAFARKQNMVQNIRFCFSKNTAQ